MGYAAFFLFYLLMQHNTKCFYDLLTYLNIVKTVVCNNVKTLITMENIVFIIIVILTNGKVGNIMCNLATWEMDGFESTPVGIVQNLSAVKLVRKGI